MHNEIMKDLEKDQLKAIYTKLNNDNSEGEAQ